MDVPDLIFYAVASLPGLLELSTEDDADPLNVGSSCLGKDFICLLQQLRKCYPNTWTVTSPGIPGILVGVGCAPRGSTPVAEGLEHGERL